jgi:hypothetical protein
LIYADDGPPPAHVTIHERSRGPDVSDDAAAFNLPEDLTGLTDEELAALSEQAVNEFDAIYTTEGGPQPADVARATDLADAIEKLDGEKGRREQVTAEAQAQLAELRSRVHGDPDATAPDGDTTDGEDVEGDGEDSVVDAPAEPAPAAGEPVEQQQGAREPALVSSNRPKGGARTGPRETGGLNPQRGRLNASLRTAQTRAPNPQVPDRPSEVVITASAATANAPIGHRFADVEALAKAMGAYARGMPVTRGNPSYTPFATLQRQYDHVMGESTDPKHVDRTIRDLTNPTALVAAGGWCAPSEVRYDFFNIACQARTGIVDLPTIGVDRGGIRWPTSPSLADVFTSPAAFAPFGATFNATSMPWLWTEFDDVATVTGTGTKPCIRVPCPTYNEAILECFGHCITAGNLASAAFPENIANFMSLVMAAQIRAENFRYLAQMVSLSTLSTAATGAGCTGAGTVAPLLGAIELAATDYRGKYGMCDDDVLEVVLPTWVKGAVRSDLAKRTAQDIDVFAVTDQMIADWLDARGVRAQFVGEYQQRTAGFPGGTTAVTAWPTTVEFMIYAAGTFVRGDGMTLDLGVVRDSTLNAENDHTAAWAEECHFIAKFGHESRRYVVPICTDGTTGAADLTACCL